jgi:hypothetical protein
MDAGADELEVWSASRGNREADAPSITASDRVAEMLASKRLRTANDLGEADGLGRQAPHDAFKPMAIVSHPTYGSGKILSASGKGLRKTVTVEFFSDGLSRSFVLQFAKLTLEQDS